MTTNNTIDWFNFGHGSNNGSGTAGSGSGSGSHASGGNIAWIKGKVRFDDDNDDTATNTHGGGLDEGVSHVVVKLINQHGLVVATTTTDKHGNYQFDVAPGTYRLDISNTQGLTFADKGVGPANLDSDFDAHGDSVFFTIGNGQSKSFDASLQGNGGTGKGSNGTGSGSKGSGSKGSGSKGSGSKGSGSKGSGSKGSGGAVVDTWRLKVDCLKM